jgi:adenylosuccinate lyase
MIDRYTTAEFKILWSDHTKFETWFKVELAACEAMECFGIVPKGTTSSIQTMAIHSRLSAERILEIDATTKHDVIAFLTHVEEIAKQFYPNSGGPARWLHFGLTSSDVVDTSYALLLTKAVDLIQVEFKDYIDALSSKVDTYRNTIMMGRSHGMHAEPITFGMMLAGYLVEAKRNFRRLQMAREEIAVGKLSGAVGSYGHTSPDIESHALSLMKLRAETVSTQVVARDRHAYLFSTLALIAAGVERLATTVRHLQRTEIGEAEEGFTKGQKGSSAMPHKKNPVLSENLCGLARMIRMSVVPAMENVTLWHERDISHSSVERMIGPDATSLTAFMLRRATGLVERLQVNPDTMASNIELSKERCFSEAVLLALVKSGMTRQDAYVIVQRAALDAQEDSLAVALYALPEVKEWLSREELFNCFDLKHALRWSGQIIDRALEMKYENLTLPVVY